MKTALVTGAAGFLGSHLSEYLIMQGFNVIAVDNLCTGQKENREHLESFGDTLIFIEQDIVAPWNWGASIPKAWLANLRYVFHFASPASPIHYQTLSMETMWANSVGLDNAISFANKFNAKLIFSSTSEVYGEPTIHPQMESYSGNVQAYSARACYSEAKRFGEALIFARNRKESTRHGVLRIFNTYGPRMSQNDGRVIVQFLLQAINNRPLTINGNGLQTRTFCYVSDLIKGIYLYADRNLMIPMNLGGGEEYTVLEVARLIQKNVGSADLPLNFIDAIIDEPSRRKPDLSVARNELSPWRPEVSLHTGIKWTFEWLMSCKSEKF